MKNQAHKLSIYNMEFDQFQVDDIFITLRNLKKQQYFEAKKKYFKKILSRCFTIYSNEQFYTYTTHCFDKSFCYIPDSSLNENNCIDSPESEKIKILNKLIKLADKLKTHYEDSKLKEEFQLLEENLAFYLNGYDQLLLHEPIYYSLFYVSDVNDHLKNLRKRLSYLLRKNITLYTRDLRQSFRSIIKFYFKNMDDESAINNVLIFSISTTLFNNSIHYYGKEGNYTKIKYT